MHLQKIPLAILALLIALIAFASDGVAEQPQPVQVIFDTDIMGDVDDVGAVAVLHALADQGEVKILAMGVSAKNPLSPLCLDALNTYYGRSEIPLGVVKGPGFMKQSKYAQQIAEEFPHALKSADGAPDAALIYRQVLAKQPDHSVVMVSVGQLTNFRNLLKTEPDQHSDLNGVELVKQKVKAWVCMGGKFPEGREANLINDGPAAAYAIQHWPTPIIFSGWEIGNEIMTGAQLREAPQGTPVRRAYELYNELKNRQSWDQTAVLYAVRGLNGGLADFWDVRSGGCLHVNDEGSNVWRESPDKNHSYLVKKLPPEKIAQIIEELMLRPRSVFAQGSGDALPPAPEGKTWNLLWHDEFDGTNLDETKWDVPPDGKRKDGWWMRKAISLDGNGHLVISILKEGDKYIDGCVRTKGKFEHAFGYYVARIQLQKQPGHWSAFWLYNQSVQKAGSDGRGGTEIDIYEKPWLDEQVQQTLHWGGYGKQHKSAGNVAKVPGVMDGWHTFGLLWLPDQYVFYVDGKETWRTSAGGVCQMPLYIKLSDEISNWAGDIGNAELPDQFLVDYMRVYDLVEKQALTLSPKTAPASSPFILGADISWVQQQEDEGTRFLDQGAHKDIFDILKDHKFNWIRLRVFCNPKAPKGYSKTGYCDLQHTVAMAKRIKAAGMGFLLDFHYSNTWADPGHQIKPAAWKDLHGDDLAKAVHDYSKDVLTELKKEAAFPDMVQIGNEISNGFLWPDGQMWKSGDWDAFCNLLKAGIGGVKEVDPSIKIMLHLAWGGQNAKSRSFLDKALAKGVEFDIIGQSYYPRWHGTLDDLNNNLTDLASRYKQDIVVVEYAAPHLKEINDIVHGLPHGKGLGTFFWEPTKGGPGGAGVFERNGATKPEIDIYPEFAEEYGKERQ